MNKSLLVFVLLLLGRSVFSQSIVGDKGQPGSFPMIDAREVPVIYTDAKDDWLVQRAAKFLQQDIEAVTGRKAEIVNQLPANAQTVVILGTVGNSAEIQKLVTAKKISVDAVKGQWDAYQIQTVSKPMEGVANALVIAGGNKRGVAYGVFELSRQMGVSPWYWWADVPVKKKAEVYLKSDALVTDAPKVRYRGIFINDEFPALTGWAEAKFGGLNHQAYEKVFELLLRLKANYLWPSMWHNSFSAFYDDDKVSPELADEYGIIMGTSHCEPMMRNAKEWRKYGKGDWNYVTNADVLREYWKEGIKRMGNRESVVTIGMRGEGDKPMTEEGTPVDLLERIVKDQRDIIAGVTGKPAPETPQLLALYKEVLEYYDKGMKVPDDVTLLFSDDNWGNIRELPKLSDKARSGGAGVYYHFDFVGGPRSYKWLNTNQISRVWEQMHLAYEFNARMIWIVNVGDIKPMEFPTSFFMDYAWDPTKIGPGDLQRYTENWAADQFGREHAGEIADILSKYTQYNSRVKPELLDVDTYSLHNYDEARRVTQDYNDLLALAQKVGRDLPSEYQAAYFELVLHPVEACANLQELYSTVALNHDAAARKSPEANALADKAEQLFDNDAAISAKYNTLLDGKWNHMMDQPHIGKTATIQMMDVQQMPAVQRVPDNSPALVEAPVAVPPVTSKNLIPAGIKGPVFYEAGRVVSMEAAHYTRAANTNGITWTIIPDIGRTSSGLTIFPVTAAEQLPQEKDSPYVEYEFYSSSKGKATLSAYFSPTLNFHAAPDGLRYAVSIDDASPQIVSINKDRTRKIWEKWVANNIIIKTTTHEILAAGKHVLKVWIVDPGVVMQKLVLDFGGIKDSFLGPPETLFKNESASDRQTPHDLIPPNAPTRDSLAQVRGPSEP